MARYPLYTTSGAWAGVLIDGYIYNYQGEWIGWLDKEGRVFSVAGEYVGWLARDFRILSRRDVHERMPRREPPTRPPRKVPVPPSAPLPRLMAELSYDVVDVFDEMPDRLHTVDADPAARDID